MSNPGNGNGSGAPGGAATATPPLVLVGAQSGVTLIPSPTLLTRLNYFDGKFLRADDLSREQTYLRRLVELSNRAGGSGVVHGFDLLRGAGNLLTLTAGLAIDPQGRVLFLPHNGTLDLQQLIERSRQSSSSGSGVAGAPGFAACETAAVGETPVSATQDADLYEITIAHAEALCGEEDVYGKLCEDACVGSTNRPYRLEGVVVRATPLALDPPACTANWLTDTHRRSQVASAYFARERARLGHEMSGQWLREGVWCRGAAQETGEAVPIAVVAVNGTTIRFLDPWTARRERWETPPPRWWRWQTMMRPTAVFWAQVLQFQCQLRDLLGGVTDPGGEDDPCAGQAQLLGEVKSLLDKLQQDGGTDNAPLVAGLSQKVTAVLANPKTVSKRVLIDGGITELPPAGYLPVSAVAALGVEEQVRRLMGPGVDLRFCAVRPDFVAHALEEAQHLDRICLLQGLADEKQRPAVDVLVPDALLEQKTTRAPGLGFSVVLELPIFVRPRDEPTGGTASEPNAQNRSWFTDDDPVYFGGKTYLKTGAVETVAQSELTQVGVYDFVPVFRKTGPAATPDVIHVRVFVGAAGVAGAGYQRYQEAVAPKVLGAGRGQPLAGGGGAFHFAGAGTFPPVGLELDFASRAELKPAVALDQASITRKTRSARSARSAPARSDAGGGGAESIVDLVRRLLGGGGSGGGVFGFQSPPPPPPTERDGRVWASVRSERDPLALSVGERGALHAEMALGSPADPSTGDDADAFMLTAMGDLVCVQAAGTGDQMRGQLTLLLGLADAGTTRQVGPVPVRVRRTAGAGGAAGRVIELLNDRNQVEATLTAEWGGAPLVAKAKLVGGVENPTEAVRATATGSAEVADPGNADHKRAVEALTVIQEGLEQPGFRAYAERLLFPPDTQAGAATLKATRDWVLFHRRRVTSCCCAPAAVQAPPRQYRVYHVLAPGSATLAQIREAVESGGVVSDGPDMRFEEVEVVPRFGGGTAELLTPDVDVVTAWKKLTLGKELLYGAVAGAGAGAGDSATLLDTRLVRLAQAVGAVTPTSENMEYDVLSAAPPGTTTTGADGVVVLVSRAEVATECHTFYLVAETETGGAVRQAMSAITSNSAPPPDLGTAQFQAGTATLVTSAEALKSALGTNQQVVRYGSVVPSGASADLQARLEARAQAVVAAMGFESAPALSTSQMLPGAALPGGCPGVMVIGRSPFPQ